LKAARKPKPKRAAATTVVLLRLYVTGRAPNSLQAIANLQAICKEHLKGSHKLEVEIVTPNDNNKVTHKFNASNFRPNSYSPKVKPLFEEVEALKAETAEKEKEIKERVAQEEAKEAEKLQQGLLGPPTKEAGKETAKEAAKEPAKDVAKEAVKPASVKEPAKPAPAPSSPSRQATDNE